MKKHLAIALTAVTLAFPLNAAVALADEATTNTSTATSTQTPTTTTTTTQDSTSGTSTTPSTTGTTTTQPTSTDTTTTTTQPTSTDTTTTTTNSTDSSTTPSVTDSTGQTVTAGTLPDSPIYWLTNLIQKLQLALNFNPLNKATLAEHQALEKLAAAQAEAQKGDTASAQKALQEYSDKITQAQQFLSSIQDPNSDAAKALAATLTNENANNVKVLSGLLAKLPPQAAQKLALNVVRSLEKAAAVNNQPTNNADNQQVSKSDASDTKNPEQEKVKASIQKIQKSLRVNVSEDQNSTNTTTSAATNTQAGTTSSVSSTSKAPANAPSVTPGSERSETATQRDNGQQGTMERSQHQPAPQTTSPNENSKGKGNK